MNVVPPLDNWISGVFDPERLEEACRTLAEAQEPAPEDGGQANGPWRDGNATSSSEPSTPWLLGFCAPGGMDWVSAFIGFVGAVISVAGLYLVSRRNGTRGTRHSAS